VVHEPQGTFPLEIFMKLSIHHTDDNLKNFMLVHYLGFKQFDLESEIHACIH
jgi:hypothetical protein